MTAKAKSKSKAKPKNLIVIHADDAAVRHECGAMVSPSFNTSGEKATCPRCHQPV